RQEPSTPGMLSFLPCIPGYLSDGVRVQAAAVHRYPGGSIPAPLAVRRSMPGMATAGHDKHRQDALAPFPKAAVQDRVDTWADSGGSGSTVLRRMPIRERSDSGGSGLKVSGGLPVRGRLARQIHREIQGRHIFRAKGRAHMAAVDFIPGRQEPSTPGILSVPPRMPGYLSGGVRVQAAAAHRYRGGLIAAPLVVHRSMPGMATAGHDKHRQEALAPVPKAAVQDQVVSWPGPRRSSSTVPGGPPISGRPDFDGSGLTVSGGLPIRGRLARQILREIQGRHISRPKGRAYMAAANFIPGRQEPSTPGMLSVPPRMSGYLSGGVRIRAVAAHRSPSGSIPAPLAVQRSMPGMATAGHDKHRREASAPVSKAVVQDIVDTWADSGGSGSTVLRRMPIRGRSEFGGSGLTVPGGLPVRGRLIRHIHREIQGRHISRPKGHAHMEAANFIPGRQDLSTPGMLSVPPRMPDYLSGGVHVQAAAAHRSPGGSIPVPLVVQRSMPGMATAGHDKHRQEASVPVPTMPVQDRVDTWADSGGSGSTVLRRISISARLNTGGSGSTVSGEPPIRRRLTRHIQRENQGLQTSCPNTVWTPTGKIPGRNDFRPKGRAHMAAALSIPGTGRQDFPPPGMMSVPPRFSGFLSDGRGVRAAATHRSPGGSIPAQLVVRRSAVPGMATAGHDKYRQDALVPVSTMAVKDRAGIWPDSGGLSSTVFRRMPITGWPVSAGSGSMVLRRKSISGRPVSGGSGSTVSGGLPISGPLTRHIHREITDRNNFSPKGRGHIATAIYIPGRQDLSPAGMLSDLPRFPGYLSGGLGGRAAAVQRAPGGSIPAPVVFPQMSSRLLKMPMGVMGKAPGSPLPLRLQRSINRGEDAPGFIGRGASDSMPFPGLRGTGNPGRSPSEHPIRHSFVQTAPQPSVASDAGVVPAATAAGPEEVETAGRETTDTERPLGIAEMDELVEKIWRRFNRKLTLEQERRGYRR
ncbi:MAG: hypothetical protein GY737_31520, partial [Desulfobacteraceae bacterium]|nr:hypothetical protein [Desulfobacteraceae bacterium]